MNEEEEVAKRTSGMPAAFLMDVCERGITNANEQMQRNFRTMEEMSATFREGSERAMKAAARTAESYLRLAASAAELSWHTLSKEGEIARSAMTQNVRGPQTDTGASLLQSFGDQITRLNAAMSDTASDMMEAMLIVTPKTGDRSPAGAPRKAEEEQ